jgi:hypothetical protein
MLGVEGVGENVDAMNRYLDGRSHDIVHAVFGDAPVTANRFADKVSEGVFNPRFNKPPLFNGCFTQLAYHMFVKAEVLRIACDCGVVLTANPIGEVLNEPMECAIVRKSAGLRRVEEFLGRTDGFLQEECGVPLTYPQDIVSRRIREHAYLPITSARDLLIRQDKFQENIELQRPPDIGCRVTEGGVRRMRAWFNEWYRRNPLKAGILIGELASGILEKTIREEMKVGTPFGETGRIPLTFLNSHDFGDYDVEFLE